LRSRSGELANQIQKVAMALGDYLKVISHACVGGTSVREDMRVLQNCQLVVGTPGRVLDLIGRGALPMEKLEFLVLDEADEMLSRGFRDQIFDIFQEMPSNVQVCLFSATIPQEVLEVT
jgi:translation initiation factor 4A